MFFEQPHHDNLGDNAHLKKDSSLIAYFHDSNKDDLDKLAADISPNAREFFDSNIIGLLGQLPEEVADTTMTLSKSALQQLLFSSMVTGYIAKSVEQKMDLEKLL